MAIWKLYRHEDEVIAPTMVVTEEGVYVETQPVHVVPVKARIDVVELIEDVLKSTAEKAQEEDLNNPEAPDASSHPILLEVLQIRRWVDFEKRSLMYTLHRNASQLTMYVTGRGGDGMWIVDNSRTRSFQINDSDSSLSAVSADIADEIISRRPIEAPLALGMALMPAPKEQD